ncbi:MAG: hypothetical protein WAU61_11415, partial [Smithella sp.]
MAICDELGLMAQGLPTIIRKNKTGAPMIKGTGANVSPAGWTLTGTNGTNYNLDSLNAATANTATTAGTANAVAVGGITGLGTGVANALQVATNTIGAFITKISSGTANIPTSVVAANASIVLTVSDANVTAT